MFSFSSISPTLTGIGSQPRRSASDRLRCWAAGASSIHRPAGRADALWPESELPPENPAPHLPSRQGADNNGSLGLGAEPHGSSRLLLPSYQGKLTEGSR